MEKEGYDGVVDMLDALHECVPRKYHATLVVSLNFLR
jgi:hypothetical protein